MTQHEATELYFAAKALLSKIDNMTTAEFEVGGDHDPREALRNVLEEIALGMRGAA